MIWPLSELLHLKRLGTWLTFGLSVRWLNVQSRRRTPPTLRWDHRATWPWLCALCGYLYLANLPAKADLRTLAATIKARWICEQAHQQLKEELGLKTARREKRIDGPPPQPTLPAVRQAILELIAQPPKQRCPHCQKWICNKQRRDKSAK